jgi:thioredoxin
MSVTSITSPLHLTTLLKGTSFLVVDFYADWCGPCHAVRPMFEKLALANSVPGHLAFVKVNVDEQPDIARQYSISAMPTFLFFQNGAPYTANPMVRGADPQALGRIAKELGDLAKDAQQKENAAAQKAAEANVPVADDGTTVSGGYAMGTAGKRSDWKMSLN